jgi:hypothetical protein
VDANTHEGSMVTGLQIAYKISGLYPFKNKYSKSFLILDMHYI